MEQQVSEITELLSKLKQQTAPATHYDLKLRRATQIKTVQATLAIEGNPLSMEQVTAVIAGKQILAPMREIQEIRNAILAYETISQWDPCSIEDLLSAHELLMRGLIEAPGRFRAKAVGIQRGNEILHLAPPAHLIPSLMKELMTYIRQLEIHPLLKSILFHYEFEFIHPFMDGNGRMGRLWQTLLLQKYDPIFALIPVESMIRNKQEEYYRSLNASNRQGTAEPFVEFMLKTIRDSLLEVTATASRKA